MPASIIQANLIFYVQDQPRSRNFYASILQLEPRLDVPGMTEFELRPGCVLGLMPQVGIKKLIPGLSFPEGAKAELYLYVPSVEERYARALKTGATELISPRNFDWGDYAAYCQDPDGHVLAFAQKSA